MSCVERTVVEIIYPGLNLTKKAMPVRLGNNLRDLVLVSATFLLSVTKHLTKINVMAGLFWLAVLGYCPGWWKGMVVGA